MVDTTNPKPIYLEEIKRKFIEDKLIKNIAKRKEYMRLYNLRQYENGNKIKKPVGRPSNIEKIKTMTDLELNEYYNHKKHLTNKKLTNLSIKFLEKHKKNIGLNSYKRINNLLVYIEQHNL